MPAPDRIVSPNIRRSRFEGRRLHRIEGGGGLPLLVAEGGQADGPPIILLHGFSQCHLCWYRQFEGRLADRFRLIAPDLRGHGGSAKPEDQAAYSDGRLWADDLAATALEMRDHLYKRELLLSVDEAISKATEIARTARKPVVLLEHADRNHDSTYTLRGLVENGSLMA